MTHNIIKTDNYLLVVDDSDIRKGDWYLRYNQFHMKCTELKTSFNEALNKEEIIIKSEGCGDPYERSKDFIKKIIAHLPLNNSPILEGVDLLPPLEDEVDEFELFLDREIQLGLSVKETIERIKWYYKQYFKAKEKDKYTEEQLKTAIHKAIIFSEENRKITSGEYAVKFYKFYGELIQSPQQPKMPVAFECEMDLMYQSESLASASGFSLDTKDIYTTKITTTSDCLIQWVGRYIY
jgi:hypothetical protein